MKALRVSKDHSHQSGSQGTTPSTSSPGSGGGGEVPQPPMGGGGAVRQVPPPLTHTGRHRPSSSSTGDLLGGATHPDQPGSDPVKPHPMGHHGGSNAVDLDSIAAAMMHQTPHGKLRPLL